MVDADGIRESLPHSTSEGGLSVLLVEDEALIALAERQRLGDFGYRVHHVLTGEQAVATVVEGAVPVDLVLMDIDLGRGIDGTEAARRILEHRDLPVVFLSSHTERDVVARTQEITSYGYVVKNSGTVVLDASITMAMRLFRERQERRRAEDALEQRLLTLTQPLDEPGVITFSDLFDLREIQQLQDDFASASNVSSLITTPEGEPITAPSRFCRLCRDIIRKTETGCFNCMQSDAVLGKPNAEGPTVEVCLSGVLWDAGAAIVVGNQHIANWLIGQVRDETQSVEVIREYARTIGAHEGDAVEAFREVPAMSREQFEKVAQALFTLARQLSSLAYQNVQQARLIAERREAEHQMARMDQYRQLIQQLSLLFINLPPERYEESIDHALEQMGQFLQVDRVYLCAYDFTAGTTSNTHEWCAPGVTAEMENLQNLPLDVMPEWVTPHLRGEAMVVSDVAALPPGALREILEPQGIRSLITVPVMLHGTCLAYAGVDVNVGSTVELQSEERQLLELFAELLANVEERRRTERQSIHAAARLESQKEAIAQLMSDQTLFTRALDATSARVAAALTRALAVSRASIWAIDDDGTAMTCLSLVAHGRHNIDQRDTILMAHVPRYMAAIREDGRVCVPNALEDPRTAELAEGYLMPRGITSLLDAGVFVSGHLVGLVSVEHVGEPRFWFPDEEAFLSTVTSFVAQLLLNREMVRQQDKMHAIQASMKAILENTFDSIWSVDRDYRIIYVNPVFRDDFRAAFGVALEAGTHIIEALPVELRGVWQERYDRALAGEQFIVVDAVETPGGTVHIEVEANPIVQGNAVTGVSFFGRNITGRREAEDRNARLVQEKELLIREMQHRVRNNMNTMISLLSLQADGMKDEGAAMGLREAQGRFRSMQVLYDQLFSTDAPAGGSFVVYIQALVRQVVDIFPLADSVAVELRNECPGEHPPSRDSDSAGDDGTLQGVVLSARRLSSLGLVVNELVTNAMKYAFRRDAVHRNVLTVITRCDAHHVEVCVADTGEGMGSRGSPDALPGEEGSQGFGLAMVDALVGQLGGTVRFAEHAPGDTAHRGTRVTVLIPREDRLGAGPLPQKGAPPQ